MWYVDWLRTLAELDTYSVCVCVYKTKDELNTVEMVAEMGAKSSQIDWTVILLNSSFDSSVEMKTYA